MDTRLIETAVQTVSIGVSEPVRLLPRGGVYVAVFDAGLGRTTATAALVEDMLTMWHMEYSLISTCRDEVADRKASHACFQIGSGLVAPSRVVGEAPR